MLDGLCFTGDIAAVRLPGYDHIRLPPPPPDIALPAWHRSLKRLEALRPDLLLLTHFGPVAGDAVAHLRGVAAGLDAYADFFRPRWQAQKSVELATIEFQRWVAQQAEADGCDARAVQRYEVVVPSYMQATGMYRYFRKFEAEEP
jgi:glyoxylase-like metal-dependent hydrolase (beta-lactamase superfamily II)